MKAALLTLGVCSVAVMLGLAAQDRGFDPGQPMRPMSRVVAAIDADHDGTISAAEMQTAPAALRTLDTNHDGQLTFDELRPAFDGRGPRGRGDGGFEGRVGRGGEEGRGAPASSADELIDTLMSFDRNGDGKLDRAEVPDRFQGLFARADGDKDGTLTRDELKQSANATVQEGAGRGRGEGDGRGFGRGRGPGMDPLIRALDLNRDGVLSEDEIGGAPDALKALDANGDGQLSGDEIRPMPGRGPEGRNGGHR
jgi:Ca2+-binding EF-hand superfamily protein